MTLIPDFLRNSEKIVNFCDSNSDAFKPREDEDSHAGILPYPSKFATWKHTDMPDPLIDLIFDDADWSTDLRDLFYFIQIQRYNIGEYIVPHRDNYNIMDLHLVTLTTSHDGLVVDDENGGLIKIPDLAGQKIEADFDKWHWVDPVQSTRYSLVITE